MGNFTTTLKLSNNSRMRATVVTNFCNPRMAAMFMARTEVVMPGQIIDMNYKLDESHQRQGGNGPQMMNVVVNYDNGTAIMFDFQVEPRNVTHMLILQPNTVLFDGSPRGQLVQAVPPQGGFAPPPGPGGFAPPPGPGGFAPPPGAQAYPPPGPGGFAPPPGAHPHPPPAAGQPPPAGGPTPAPPSDLPQGATVLLQCASTNKNLRIKGDGSLDGNGGEGKWARFTVEPSQAGYLRLRNVGDNSNYLAIRGGICCSGKGGKFCELSVFRNAGRWCFRSVHADEGLGITPDGKPKSSTATKYGPHGQFTIRIL